MHVLSLVLLGAGLSVDSLAVSITIGVCSGHIKIREALKVGLYFAFFQTLMPFLGYLAGRSLASFIAPFDHWIAFALLAVIGLKMIYENLHEKTIGDDEADLACPAKPLASGRLAMLGLATSIDAMAAGVSLAVGETFILLALLLIGSITFAVAFSGALLGRRMGVLFQKHACVAGGVVLVLIGLRFVFEHYFL